MRTAKRPSSSGLDRLHLADDVAQHGRVVDRFQRHLDALLDRDRLGARLDRRGVAAHVIGDPEPHRSWARHHQRVDGDRTGLAQHHRIDVHCLQPIAESNGKVLQREQ